MGNLLLSYTMFFDFITKMQLATWFLSFYIIFYNIAHRILILTTLIAKLSCAKPDEMEVNCLTSNIQLEAIRKIQDIGYLFNNLAKATHEIKRAVSLPSFLVVVSAILSCIIHLFIVTRKLIQNPVLDNEVCLQILFVGGHITEAVVIILSVELPIQEVRRSAFKNVTFCVIIFS